MDAEIEQARWLTSPVFASGLTAVHLPQAHPLRYLADSRADMTSPTAAAAFAVANQQAYDGVDPAIAAYLKDLVLGEGQAEWLHATVLVVIDATPADAQLVRMLVGWLLVHTGAIYQAAASSDAAAPTSFEALLPIWRAADALGREMASVGGVKQAVKCAELLLATVPLALPPPPRLPPPPLLKAACEGLSEHAMQWLRSRTDSAAMMTCLQAQQSRALSRAAGLRLAASILHVYSAQPHVVSHLLELIQKANNR